MVSCQKLIWVVLFLHLLSYKVLGADYFWIGGSGDWSEISHWATTSGGILTHDQTPTASDNVYFDENSFSAPGQIVTINGDLAFARNLDFSQVLFNPHFQADEQTSLTIYGGCTLIEEMDFHFDGTIIFAGNSVDLEIDFAGHTLGENIVFDGSGEWNVLSNITVSNEVNILQGNINFQSDSISCNFFTSATDLQRRIDFNQTTLVVNGTTDDLYHSGSILNTYTVRLHTAGLSIDGGTSTMMITSDYAKIYTERNGSINFNNILVNNSNGLFELINLYDETQINIEGTLDIRHSGTILSTIEIDTLRLTPSFSYQFQSGLETTLGHLDAVGSCVETILLSSTVSGDPVIFRASNTLTASFVTIRDIHVIGAGGQSDNSIDLGNNVGWMIMSKDNENFFWVGGTGNWNDPANWSSTSGGPSAGCIPSSLDNVFFDENSFTQPNQKVTINVLNATCRDMIWSDVFGYPSFSGAEQSGMYINGSLSFTREMIHDFQGSYYFISGEKGNTITTSGQGFNADLNFNNFEGEWIFQDSVYVHQTIYLQDGSLNTNDQAVVCSSFNSDFYGPRSLTLGSSTIKVIERDQLIYWRIRTDNFTLEAGNSHIIMNGWYAEFNNFGNNRVNYNNVTHKGNRGGIQSYFENGDVGEFNMVTFEKDGRIEGSSRIETLKLSSGWSYSFNNGYTSYIGKIIADDPCDGLVSLSNYSYSPSPAYIELTETDTLNGFLIKGISFISNSPVQAIASVDAGYNNNVEFVEESGRTLYWVGGDGDWNDGMNWSLSSGGPGGVCIPNASDDIIFDENSFDSEFDRVYGENAQNAFCHDLNFNVPKFNGFLDIFVLNVYGDINFTEAWRLYGSSLEMLSNEEPQSIISNGTIFQQINLRGSQLVTFQDDIYIENGLYIGGPITFQTQGYNFDMNNFQINSNEGIVPSLQMSESRFTIRGEKFPFFFPFSIHGNVSPEVEGVNTVFEFTHETTGAQINTPIELGSFLFNNSEGSSEIRVYEQLVLSTVDFSNDGIISGAAGIEMDSLILNSGKSYQFESTKTQKVNKYLKALGNNCTPIEWRSSLSGVRADVQMTSGTRINMDFVELRDIRAIGEGMYNAGSHSTDIANSNEGWIFPEVTDEVEEDGFFGPDILVCDDAELILQPFDENEISSIIWSTGSNEVSINVTENTTIGAFVTFANNCTIQDTVSVTFDEAFQIDLGADTTLCEGESLTLDLNLANANYLWQDGSVSEVYELFNQGSYYVEVAVSTCKAADTINVEVQSQIELNMADQLEACIGESIVLDASIEGQANYNWSTEEITSSIEVFDNGIYDVRVELEACVAMDTVEIIFHQLPDIEALDDQSICDGESISVGIQSIPNHEYLWSTGQDSAEINIEIEGEYSITVTNENGCSNGDSMLLTVRPLPRFDIPADTLICEGEILELSVESSYDSYNWSTGETSSFITTNTPGMLVLTSTLDGCVYSDSTAVTVQNLPIANLGNDTSICDGQTINFDLSQQGASYLWSDGTSESSFNTSLPGIIAVEVDINGCISSDEINLSIKETPYFELDPEFYFCTDESVDLSIDAQDDWTILWSTGASEQSVTISQTGEVSVETELDGCVYNQTSQVIENSLPEFDLGPDGKKCEESVITLSIPLPNVEIMWQDGTIGQSYNVINGGKYSATAISQNGCVFSDEIEIENVTCTRFSIYTPNAFSPNNDGVNDLFRVGITEQAIILDYEMQIYDRWGNQVFATRDINAGWNGRFLGRDLMPGTYIWAIRVRYSDDFVEDEQTSLRGSLYLSN